MQPSDPPEFRGATRATALATARKYLRLAGLEQADEDARLLTFAACDFDRLGLLQAPDVPISEAQAGRLGDFVARRASREPARRIIGRRPFWTLDLQVRPGVLDPRADSEAVIRLALRLFQARPQPRSILDLGAGSGALLCALLSEFHDAQGVAADISAEALQAAAENLAACGLAARSQVVRSRWTEAVAGPFDLIVSNPPYIATNEIEGLDLEVRAHDPHVALDGGADGFDAYRCLFAECPELLCPDGVLVLEFGAGQHRVIREMAAVAGLSEAGSEFDLGGHERALAFSRRP
jgi:release factor glutamine methyltransferase